VLFYGIDYQFSKGKIAEKLGTSLNPLQIEDISVLQQAPARRMNSFLAGCVSLAFNHQRANPAQSITNQAIQETEEKM
jgi:hypothetical protein